MLAGCMSRMRLPVDRLDFYARGRIASRASGDQVQAVPAQDQHHVPAGDHAGKGTAVLVDTAARDCSNNAGRAEGIQIVPGRDQANMRGREFGHGDVDETIAAILEWQPKGLQLTRSRQLEQSKLGSENNHADRRKIIRDHVLADPVRGDRRKHADPPAVVEVSASPAFNQHLPFGSFPKPVQLRRLDGFAGHCVQPVRFQPLQTVMAPPARTAEDKVFPPRS